MRVVRSAWGQPIAPRDPAQVKGAAQDILGQAQFRPPERSIPDRVLHWIAQQLSSLFGGSTGSSLHIPPVIIVVILAGLVVAVVVIIVRQGGFRPIVRRDRRRSPAVLVSADDLGIADDVWLARAVTAETAGDWREGIRCRYRSLVAVIVAAGVVQEEIGRTAGEYRTLVERILREAAAPFVTATATFERAWYGQVEVGPAERDVLVSVAPLIRHAAQRYRRAEHDDGSSEPGEPASMVPVGVGVPGPDQ
ncbi:MAG: DUF4129 domain-containing protein [Actinomycetota bacterium]|nr:DUF4129 domain-containing protein [Actinomycetota bacterium]